jgi:hypothetical protein
MDSEISDTKNFDDKKSLQNLIQKPSKISEKNLDERSLYFLT